MHQHLTESQLIGVIEAARIVDQYIAEKQWIPSDLKTTKTFFGAYDFWMYIAEGPLDTNCDTCRELDAQDFTGNQLRMMFPDLVIIDEDTIRPNVHQTLWGKDTCKCVLRRLGDDPSNFVAYGGPELGAEW